MKIAKEILRATLILSFAFFFIFILNESLSKKESKWPDSPLIGKPAPDFSLKSLGDGRDIGLSNIKGSPAVLNFWASWCLPCAEEAEEINRAVRKYGKSGVVFIGINVMDARKDAIGFIVKHRTEYQNGYDPDRAVHIDYGVVGVPETFFIAPDGTIFHKTPGQISFSEISEILDRLIRADN